MAGLPSLAKLFSAAVTIACLMTSAAAVHVSVGNAEVTLAQHAARTVRDDYDEFLDYVDGGSHAGIAAQGAQDSNTALGSTGAAGGTDATPGDADKRTGEAAA